MDELVLRIIPKFLTLRGVHVAWNNFKGCGMVTVLFSCGHIVNSVTTAQIMTINVHTSTSQAVVCFVATNTSIRAHLFNHCCNVCDFQLLVLHCTMACLDAFLVVLATYQIPFPICFFWKLADIKIKQVHWTPLASL